MDSITITGNATFGVAHVCPPAGTLMTGDLGSGQGWTLSAVGADSTRERAFVGAGVYSVAPKTSITGVVSPHLGRPPG